MFCSILMSILTVRLDRTDSNTSWGFRMAGGKDFGTPLQIQRVSIDIGQQKWILGSRVMVQMHIPDSRRRSLGHKECEGHCRFDE